MSLITRCPACDTMFKVVPDQLRISEGWVRCGQCSEIFNASQHLLTPPGQAPEPAPQPAPSAPPAGPPPAPVGFAPSAPVSFTPAEMSTTTAQQPDQVLPEPAPGPVADIPLPASAPVQREPHWADPVADAEPAAAPVAPTTLADASIGKSEPAPDTEPWPQQAVAAAEPDVSFLRSEGSADAFWKRRPVRIALVLLAIALAAALAAQILLQERNRIVQIEPATRPVLAALCALARCELGALKQIDSIVIDSSSFGRVRADNYRLGFALRNTAPIDVAMPAIELSLTDTQDQAVIRRVIRPDEFGAPTPVLAAGSDWSASVNLSVRSASNSERIAGYRLLAFYP